MTAGTLPRLTAKQWEYLAKTATDRILHTDPVGILNQLARKQLITIANEPIPNRNHTRRIVRLTEQGQHVRDLAIHAATEPRTTVPAPVRGFALTVTPERFLTSPDPKERNEAIRNSRNHIPDTIMSRLAHDPDPSIRGMAAVAATDRQETLMFTGETDPTVIRHLSPQWLHANADRIIRLRLREPMERLAVTDTRLTARQLTDITRTHLCDETILEHRFRDDTRHMADEWTWMSDTDLTEIIMHGTDAGRITLLDLSWKNAMLHERLTATSIRLLWAGECGPRLAERLMDQTDDPTDPIIGIIRDRHVNDDALLRRLARTPQGVDDATLTGVLEHGDPKALETAGLLDHRFTSRQIMLLETAHSCSFTRRLDAWRTMTDCLFAGPDAIHIALDH